MILIIIIESLHMDKWKVHFFKENAFDISALSQATGFGQVTMHDKKISENV